MGWILSRILFIFCVILFKDLQMATCSKKERHADNYHATWDQCLPINKVIGGEKINITDAPFILQKEENGIFDCGAIIISEKVALTAVHCTGHEAKMRLRSGGSLTGQGNVHSVRKIVKHELYNGTYNYNDIALIFVKEQFHFSDSVQPIKLPTKELKAETLAMVAGYGITKFRPGSVRPSQFRDLRRISVPIIDREMCNKIMKKKWENKYHEVVENLVTKTTVCAGYPYGEKDACQGDSGGPLYSNGTLYGIVSWGFGCAAHCSPGLYANVYGFLDWINKNIAENIED